MFLNFEISPLKAQKDLTQVSSSNMEKQIPNAELNSQERIQQQRAYYAAYVKKVKGAAAPGLSEQNRGILPEQSSAPAVINQHTEQLFEITVNPYVPDFILQGNYVVHGSSPNKQYTSYIYPDDWETIGDIYIKDSENNLWTQLHLDQQYRVKMWNSFAPEGRYTPKKKMIWLNNEEFITIIGFAHGTVSKGGDLVKVTPATGEAEIIYPAYRSYNQEVVNFEQEGEELVIEINIFDANGFSLEKKELRVDLEDLDSLSE